jgi:hypothetical protein
MEGRSGARVGQTDPEAMSSSAAAVMDDRTRKSNLA